jgi:lysozyme
VLVEMIFNMGVKGLMSFRRMLAALGRADYQEAAREMLNSRWAEQVGARAVELANIMREG